MSAASGATAIATVGVGQHGRNHANGAVRASVLADADGDGVTPGGVTSSGPVPLSVTSAPSARALLVDDAEAWDDLTFSAPALRYFGLERQPLKTTPTHAALAASSPGPRNVTAELKPPVRSGDAVTSARAGDDLATLSDGFDDINLEDESVTVAAGPASVHVSVLSSLTHDERPVTPTMAHATAAAKMAPGTWELIDSSEASFEAMPALTVDSAAAHSGAGSISTTQHAHDSSRSPSRRSRAVNEPAPAPGGAAASVAPTVGTMLLTRLSDLYRTAWSGRVDGHGGTAASAAVDELRGPVWGPVTETPPRLEASATADSSTQGARAPTSVAAVCPDSRRRRGVARTDCAATRGRRSDAGTAPDMCLCRLLNALPSRAQAADGSFYDLMVDRLRLKDPNSDPRLRERAASLAPDEAERAIQV